MTSRSLSNDRMPAGDASLRPERDPPQPQTGWLGGLVRALDGLAALCMLVASIMMVTLIVIFGWLVFGRYVLNDTPTWVEQASLLLVVWITFLGAGVGVWRHSHLSIEFVRDAFPAVPRHVLSIVADAALVVFGGFMAWYGTSLALGTAQRIIPMLGIAEAWRAVPLAVCGVLTVVFSLVRLATRLSDSQKGRR